MTLTNYIEGLSLSKTTADEPAAPGLEGALESFRRESDATPPRETAPLPANLKAAVDAGSLLSFVEGLSVQEREDVLYSVQLAQRAATGQFDRFTQTHLWYQKYSKCWKTWAGRRNNLPSRSSISPKARSVWTRRPWRL